MSLFGQSRVVPQPSLEKGILECLHGNNIGSPCKLIPATHSKLIVVQRIDKDCVQRNSSMLLNTTAKQSEKKNCFQL